MRKIKKKIMALCAMIMTLVMLLDITPFSVYATADIATPTDAGMGELVFVPESKEGEAYRPVKAGAAGVVYEVYDDRGSLAGEFVLSYDGRAYAGSDGETLVYTSEDAGKEAGKQEKTPS